MTHKKFTNSQYANEIRTVLSNHFGEPLHTLEPNVSFTDSIIYTGTAGAQTAIFKMIDPVGSDADIVVQEAWCYDRARGAGLPTPEVYRLDTSCSHLPAPYMLVSKAPGSDMRAPQFSSEEIQPYLLKFGEAMKTLHSIPVEGFGPLIVADDGRVRGKYDDWEAAALAAVEPGLATLATNPHFDQKYDALARQLIIDQKHLLATITEGKLIHGDLGLIHFFADLKTGELTGIIDFGECKAGDPVWDFVDFRWRYVNAIADGYGLDEEEKEDFNNRFYLYAILRNLIWSLKWSELVPEDAAEKMMFVIGEAGKYFGVH